MKATRAVILLGATLWAPTVAAPCSCVCVSGEPVGEQEVKEHLRNTLDTVPIIFLGRVVAVEPDKSDPGLPPEYADRIATLAVIREWRGPGKPNYLMRTPCCSASCGYPVAVGQVHLLFLEGEPGGFNACCGDPTKAELRRTIRLLDKLTRQKPLALPGELH